MAIQEGLSKETRNLVSLFSYSKKLEIIPWNESEDAVGLSIIKDYPDRGRFVPARNKLNKKDSVAMIRVWYLKSDVTKYRNRTKVKLRVAIKRVSRYLFNHLFNNSDDPESPTERSIARSTQSKQPIDLEESNRYFLVNERRINDVEKNEYVKPKGVIEDIYRAHLNTTSNYFFQLKIYLRQFFVDSIDPLKKFLLKVNLRLFGKDIEETKDVFRGVFSPYSYSQLKDNPETLKMKILGSDLPISYNTAITFTTLITTLFMVNYFLNYDLLGIIGFIKGVDNVFFLTVLIAEALWIFDFVIPRLILLIVNRLIKIYLYLIDLRVKT